MGEDSVFWSSLDEGIRECLAVVVKRSITLRDLLDQLYMLFLIRRPEHVRVRPDSVLGYCPPAPDTILPAV